LDPNAITVKSFLFNEVGLELSEYAVAAALITAAIFVALTTLGNIVTNSINTLANQITP
jgi:Flp pilus assembly pilin Flp